MPEEQLLDPQFVAGRRRCFCQRFEICGHSTLALVLPMFDTLSAVG